MGQILSAHHLQVNQASVARKRRVKRRVTRLPSQHLRRHRRSLLPPHPCTHYDHSTDICSASAVNTAAPKLQSSRETADVLRSSTSEHPGWWTTAGTPPATGRFVVSPAVLTAPVALVCCWPSGDVSAATSVVSTIAAAGMKCIYMVDLHESPLLQLKNAILNSSNACQFPTPWLSARVVLS